MRILQRTPARNDNHPFTPYRQENGEIRLLDPLRIAVAESRDRAGILSFLLRPISTSFSNLQLWYSSSVLPILLNEIYAVCHRIRLVLEIREVEHLRGTETVALWMGRCAVTGRGTPNYIAYIQQVLDRYPFLSIFDSLLLTEAWKAGSESNGLPDTLRGRADTVRS
jgi:hypothetical protein